MQAKVVAEEIKRHGFPVLEVTEGDDVVDGCVQITQAVSVQVPFYGTGLNVTKEAKSGIFKLYPVRDSYTKLVADLHEALGTINRKGTS